MSGTDSRRSTWTVLDDTVELREGERDGAYEFELVDTDTDDRFPVHPDEVPELKLLLNVCLLQRPSRPDDHDCTANQRTLTHEPTEHTVTVCEECWSV